MEVAESHCRKSCENDSMLIAGKYEGDRAPTWDRINPRCLIEPRRRREEIIVHVRECVRDTVQEWLLGEFERAVPRYHIPRDKLFRDLATPRLHPPSSLLPPPATPTPPFSRASPVRLSRSFVWERNSPRRMSDYWTMRFLAAQLRLDHGN